MKIQSINPFIRFQACTQIFQNVIHSFAGSAPILLSNKRV